MTTLPEPPRSPLVDVRTGALAREWVRFFDDLRRAIVSGLDDEVGGRLDALEADSLFGGGDGSSGSNTDYNDAVIRNRLTDIETELLWLSTDQTEARAATATVDADAQLEAIMATDATGAIRQLRRAIVDLETAQAMTVDASATIAALAKRLGDLEIEGAFR